MQSCEENYLLYFCRIDPYHVPSDSIRYIKPDFVHMSKRQSSLGSGKTIQRPESGIYSEVSDQPQTPPTRRSDTSSKKEQDRPYEEVDYHDEVVLSLYGRIEYKILV